MIDLTGGLLASFILGELRPVLARHPRFRDNDGSALVQFSNLISYNDVSLTVSGLTSDGTVLSPDSFMCTAMGRACVAKLEGYNGSFIEWIRETDLTAAAGIYYLAVTAVNQETREVQAVMETYRWLEGSIAEGYGSRCYLAGGIPASVVVPVDSTVDYVQRQFCIEILSYVENLALRRTDTNVVLTPGVDYWLEMPETRLLVVADGGKQEGIPVPEDCVSFRLLEDGNELRRDVDWMWDGDSAIKLPAWTTAGASIYIDGTFRKTPSGSNYIHGENFLNASLAEGEELVAGQATYSLVRGEYLDDLAWTSDGRACFKHLLAEGDRATWEIRIRKPQETITFKKMAVNPGFLPGLEVAVGDLVEVGDQLALIVFPSRCEVYEVYGGKEGVTFDLAIKSNDMLTSSELGGLVRTYLAVGGRDRLESCGLTINRILTSYQGSQRDNSGTSASHTITLSVSAQADWEVHKPLVNRVDAIDLDFSPALKVMAQVSAAGATRFVPAYQ